MSRQKNPPRSRAAAQGAKHSAVADAEDYSPRWKSNNTGGFSPDALDLLRQVQEEKLAEHGLDPCTLKQTAAHEAGHVVMATALGDTIKGCRIFRCRASEKLLGQCAWLGTTHRDPRVHSGLIDTREASADRLVYEALNAIAGVVAEQIVGHYHPGSSLDEILYAQIVCSELAARYAADCETLYDSVFKMAGVLLVLGNRREFDLVRGHLERRRRLTSTEAARMLAGIQPIDPDHLLQMVRRNLFPARIEGGAT